MPFLVLVTYWPKYEDDTYVALMARICVFIIFLSFVSTLTSADSLVITHLIMLSFKIENLKSYLEVIKKDNLSSELSHSAVKQRYLEGLILHSKIQR